MNTAPPKAIDINIAFKFSFCIKFERIQKKTLCGYRAI